MKKVQVVFHEKKPDVLPLTYPEEFGLCRFLGFETRNGERYIQVNWASSEENFAFWYPFVGGANISLYNQGASTEEKLRDMLKQGVSYKFDSRREMYLWMSEMAGEG